MSRAETLAGLTEAIAGHQYVTPESEDEYGMHNYACQCGEPMHECYEDDAWAKHAAHVAAVALAWLEGQMTEERTMRMEAFDTPHGRGTGSVWYARRVTAWAPVETGEDA